MKPILRTILFFQLMWISLVSPLPTSKSPNGKVCIEESELKILQKRIETQKQKYVALSSDVCLLTNQQAANSSTANQNTHDISSSTNQSEDDKILTAWVDLYQLNLNVKTLFDNYTAWLQTSKQRTQISSSNSIQDGAELKTVVFSLWLQLQEFDKRIDQLERSNNYDNSLDDTKKQEEPKPTGSTVNKFWKSSSQNRSKSTDKLSRNDIYKKLDPRSDRTNMFPNDLHNLQGQIKDLNATVVVLADQMMRIERGTTLQGKSETAENLLEELANQQQQPITNETCNGRRRHLVGNSCYFIPQIYESEQMSTWWDARYFCKQPEVLGEGGDLVVIESKQEMDDIRRLLTNHFGGIEAFWIGATDIDKEGHWIWAPNNTPLSSGATFWLEQPRPDTLTNCAAMEQGYSWIPEPCYYERVPLCELQL